MEMLHLEENPIIAAVRTEEELLEAVKSPVEIIFLLRTGILTLKRQIDAVHKANKLILSTLTWRRASAMTERVSDTSKAWASTALSAPEAP